MYPEVEITAGHPTMSNKNQSLSEKNLHVLDILSCGLHPCSFGSTNNFYDVCDVVGQRKLEDQLSLTDFLKSDLLTGTFKKIILYFDLWYHE